MRFLKETWDITDDEIKDDDLEVWDIESQTGYKPITNYYREFSIAEKYSDVYGVNKENVIKYTFMVNFVQAKKDYKLLTEFVMVLNWKLWRWHGHDDKLAHLYDYLWQQADDYAMNTLEGEELSYFIRVTD